MRKTFCTATIFAAMVVGIAGLFLIRVDDTCWWWEGYPSGRYALLATWIFGNVVIPLGAVVGVSSVLFMAWALASSICSKLRGEKAQQ